VITIQSAHLQAHVIPMQYLVSFQIDKILNLCSDASNFGLKIEASTKT